MNKTILIVGSGLLLGGILLYFMKPKVVGTNTSNANNNNPQTCPRGQELFEMDCLNPPCPKICMPSLR